MPATISEVKQLIQTEFPTANVDQVTEENHRITGTIVWQDFKGKTIEERNRLVTERIRNRLGLNGMYIGVLFALAPGEKL